MTTIGLAIVARDEEERLPSLLASVEGVFDRVVLLDTGSEDDTKKVFTRWAMKQTGVTYSVGDYKWCDDFGDARTHADRLLIYGHAEPPPNAPALVDWTCWADCDDVIHNAPMIRILCEGAEPHVAAFLVGYDYGRSMPGDGGENISYLWRERMVRAGQGRWHYRVHEAQEIVGGIVQPVPSEQLEWRHRKYREGEAIVPKSNDRNLRILKKWNQDEPDDARVLAYLGIESLIAGEFEDAKAYYEAYFKLDPEWNDERAQAHRRYAMALMHFEDFDGMIATALEALHIHPSWPDTYLTLAEAYLAKGDGEKSFHWANEVITKGPPKFTLMVVNPTDYTFLPMKIAAGAKSLMGDIDTALDLALQALSIVPDQPLAHMAQVWQKHVKKEQTADVFGMAAQQLIAHDEQLKALTLLEECPPHFVIDHPKVVNIRSQLRERILWMRSPDAYAEHYTTGGSKPEDFEATGDQEKVDKVCKSLPRAKFLLENVLEQAGVGV